MNSLRKKDKVSILIPVFNRETYIAECIQSALFQTYTDFEVVIVDNASTDQTWAICQKFAERDHRVRIFRNEENVGPVRNWIRCVEEATGEYSKILFSDDCLAPECISEMLPALENRDVAFVYCSALVGESKESACVEYNSGKSTLLSFSQYLNLLLQFKAPVSPGAILIRAVDLINNLHTNFPTATPRPFDRHGAGPDVMISLLTAEKYKAVAYIGKPLVYFRAHSGSFSIGHLKLQVMEGYLSAISFFLKKKCSQNVWSKYLTYSWLLRIRQRKKWLNPVAFLKEYEGNGSILELVLMAYQSICIISSKFIFKRFNLLK
ncbi:glycosyltransferase family 2 protein [Iodobacter sp. HSC-16F04]|uniref:Glycosyltransferase family 2 protein n=1 Tax=Iodobacter violaceini TaxID=3044271 RepID=A0ABX0L0E6_9NEIS|nr:glycosyltransferase [Iodobacter violacea]NHQ85983.1 glycosyltransferase family 2 protein [Iodobacter violacea]